MKPSALLTVVTVDPDPKKLWLARDNYELDEGMWRSPSGGIKPGDDWAKTAYAILSKYEFWANRLHVIDDVVAVSHQSDRPDEPEFHRYLTVLATIYTHHREKFVTDDKQTEVRPFSLQDLEDADRNELMLLNIKQFDRPEIRAALGEM